MPVQEKVTKSVDFLNKIRNKDDNFLSEVDQNTPQNFPIPTFLNPNAVYRKTASEYSSEAQIKLAEKKISIVDGVLAKNKNIVSDSNEPTSKMDKLIQLRRKLLEVRKANEESVIEEQKLISQQKSQGFLKRKYREQQKEKYNEELKNLEYMGADISRKDISYKRLLVTAEQARRKKIKEEKSKLNFERSKNRGGLYNEDAAFMAYQRRVNKLEESKREKANANEKINSNEVNSKNQSKKSKRKNFADVREEKIEAMASELRETENRRMQMREKSRKQNSSSRKNVSGINQNNDKWNKRLGRAFDKYTVETRENLERGTAL